MAAPTFVALGTPATGIGDVVPGLPTGHTTNDLLLLAVETSAQAVATPTGYTIVPNFPIENATATTRLSLFYKFDNGSEAAPTVTDPGDHAYAVIIAYRGVDTLNPFHQIAGLPHATGTTSIGWAGMKTSIDDCMIVCVASWNIDNAGPLTSAVTNSSLASLSTRQDAGTTDGNGGGLIIIDGTKAARGSVLSTTCTLGTTSAGCCGTLALTPSGGAQVVVVPPIDSFFIKGGPIMSDVELGDTVYYRFCTVNADGSAADADSTPTVGIEEDGGSAATMGASVADIGVGIYRVTVPATSGNGFEVGKRYNVMVTATVGGRSSSEPIAEFMVRTAPAVAGTYPATVADYESGKAPLQPTTAGRTLDVSTGGEAGVDWANVGSPTTTVGLSGTTVKTATDVATDVTTLLGRLTSTRAGYLDNLSAGAVALQSTALTIAGYIDTEITSLISSVAALPTANNVRDAILGATLRTGRTLRGHWRRMDALFFGKNTGLLGSLVTGYQPDEATEEFTAAQNTTAGTREKATVTNSEVP
jgi:hypothetical protein